MNASALRAVTAEARRFSSASSAWSRAGAAPGGASPGPVTVRATPAGAPAAIATAAVLPTPMKASRASTMAATGSSRRGDPTGAAAPAAANRASASTAGPCTARTAGTAPGRTPGAGPAGTVRVGRRAGRWPKGGLAPLSPRRAQVHIRLRRRVRGAPRGPELRRDDRHGRLPHNRRTGRAHGLRRGRGRRGLARHGHLPDRWGHHIFLEHRARCRYSRDGAARIEPNTRHVPYAVRTRTRQPVSRWWRAPK